MSDNKVTPEIQEEMRKLEVILNKMEDEDRKFLEGHLSIKNNSIRQLGDNNRLLIQMISDVWEIIQNISSNTTTNVKSIVRVLQPVLTPNQQQN